VPGSGLGRFAIDLTLDGYDVEANEISAVHLLALAWILNEMSTSSARSYQLFPWATQFSNHADSNRQFESYAVPAMRGQTTIPKPELLIDENGNFELKAGENFRIKTWDFVQGYGPPQSESSRQVDGKSLIMSRTSSVESLETRSSLSSPGLERFDAVATVFFIDTAQNVLEYIKTVHHALQEGGIWVNSGPLLWNSWENGPSGRGEGDSDQDETAQARGVRSLTEPSSQPLGEEPNVPSVELTWDELLELLEMNGFQVVESDYGKQAGFVHDVKSMGVYGYKIGFFKAIKV
jgi:carnosine N-methyltransferase